MKRITAILAVLLLLLSACTGIKTASADTWQEQYDLGVRYLSEGNYEEAILAFTAAIEIDPKRPEAYVGRGDAYVVKAEAVFDDVQAAYDAYQTALQDYEQAVALGAADVESKQAAVQEALDRLAVQLHTSELLKPLYDQFSSGDIGAAKALMRQDDYRSMSALLSSEHLYYDEGGENGLGVYKDNYYYFGQWQDGQRSGRGLWIRAAYNEDSNMESYTFEGDWANDLPNGSGTATWNHDASKIVPEEGVTHSVWNQDVGTFRDGLYHGTIYETWHMDSGEIMEWSPITAIDGVYQPMNGASPREDGSYLVALTLSGSDLNDHGNIKRVSGLD